MKDITTSILLLLSLLLATNAHPLVLQTRNATAPSTVPNISCATIHSSPETSLLLRAATAFTSICNPLAPPEVPTSNACITLMEDTNMGFTINFCGWEAIMTDCADAMRAVEGIVKECDDGAGRAAGQAEWEWGTVSIAGVVGRNTKKTKEEVGII